MPERVFHRVTRINNLIQIKATGTPKQLAHKINVSERTLYGLLKAMKKYGAPVKYNRFKQTYYYEESGSFKIKFIKNTE
ncbi:MAG: HTH domain-containing protein [Chitinophagaceae bacterium]|nr:HTH domain-containing protein [Chitinophagaceae bacterium]